MGMTDQTVLPKKPAPATLIFILSSAFLFAMGLGLLLPILPYLVGRYVPDPTALAATVSWLSVSYAACAFFSAPVLGALSDRYGRRPVLLISLLGSAIGYFIFGWAGTLALMFVGRIIDGITAGNFSANFGMLADSTAPEERGKYFGQIGAAIGGGFILGPALGGLISHISLEAPVFVAAGLCLLNLLWGVLFVPETLHTEQRSKGLSIQSFNPFSQILELLAIPHIRRLLLSSTLFMLPFAMMQILLGVLLKTSLNWGPAQTSTVFMVVGVSDIVVQGLLLGWLISKLGDMGVARLGLGLGLFGLLGMGLLVGFPSSGLVYASVLAFAIGEGIFTATVGALLSQAAGEQQGKVQGGSQALGSAAQVVGPLIGGQLSSRAGIAVPFYAGIVLVALAGMALQQGSSASGKAPATLPEI